MDRLQILNNALSKLGEEEQLDDPDAPTPTARLLNANWDAQRDVVLRAHFWNFATDPAGTPLTPDASFVPHRLGDWTNRYVLPRDFLRHDLQRMRPRGLRHDSRIAGRYLYTRCSGTILLVYVRRVEAVGEWDAMFGEAFACRLAAQAAARIDGNSGKRRELMQEYRAALAHAAAVDGRENPGEDFEDSDWITARYTGGRTVGTGW
jgi:hypothetical protein